MIPIKETGFGALVCGLLVCFLGTGAEPCRGDVQDHDISRGNELIAIDLEHGSGPSRVAVRRALVRSPSRESHFGKGWGDLNVVRLRQHDGRAVSVWRGGRLWLYAQGSEGVFKSSSGHTLRKTADGWNMENPREGSWAFNEAGLLVAFRNPFGQVTQLAYDRQGRLLAVEHDADNVLRYSYGSGTNRVSRIDGPEGLRATYQYDDAGRLAAVTNGRHIRIEYEYAADGALVSAKDQFGGRLQLGARVEVEPPDESAQAELARRRAAELGDSASVPPHSYKTNPQGLITEAHDSGRTVSLKYDDTGRLASVDMAGQTQSYAYDAYGRVTAVTEADGSVNRIAYNRLGLPVEIVASDGTSTKFAYNDQGLLLSLQQASGTCSERAYDGRGRIARESERPGVQADYSYDERDRIVRVQQSDGSEVRYTYDDRNRLLGEEWNSGQVWRYAYDDAGRLVQQTSPSGLTTRYGYDEAGRLLWQEDPLHGRTTYDRTKASENEMSVEHDGQGIWSVRMNASLLPITLTDPAKRTTRYQYDDSDQVAAVSAPSGRTWRYQYDPAGRQLAVTAPGGLRTAQTYDRGGRIMCVKRGEVVWREYDYDARGRLHEERSPAGPAAVCRYNSAGLVDELTLPDGKATFRYDALGQLVSAKHPNYAVLQEYHPDGQLARRVYEPPGLELRLPLDGVGRRAGIQLNGVAVTYGYDQRGQLAAIGLPGGSQIPITSDEAGRPIRLSYGDDVAVGVAYDRNDRITSVGAIGRNEELAFLEQYGYDLVGNLTQMTPQGQPTRSYGYDADDRLTEARTPSGPTSYSYSADGHLQYVTSEGKSAHWTLDASGRPTRRDASCFYSWDAGGNLTAVRGLDASSENRFDAAGRLTERHTRDGRWSYGYLPDGDRLWQAKRTGTDSEARTWYVYLPEGLVGLKDSEGVTWLLVCLPGTDWPLALCGSNGTDYFVLADRLRSIRRLIDRSGRVIAQADYGPFGGTVHREGTSPLWTFAGMACDASGLCYARQRYYDPEMSRFISMDPWTGSHEFPASHNAYAYAGNNPCRNRDPNGAATNEWWWNPNPEHMSNEELVEYFHQLKKRGSDGCTPGTSRLIDDHAWNQLMKRMEEVREELFRRHLAKPVDGPPIVRNPRRGGASASTKAETVYNGKLPRPSKETLVSKPTSGNRTRNERFGYGQTQRNPNTPEPGPHTTEVHPLTPGESTQRLPASGAESSTGRTGSAPAGETPSSAAGTGSRASAQPSGEMSASQTGRGQSARVGEAVRSEPSGSTPGGSGESSGGGSARGGPGGSGVGAGSTSRLRELGRQLGQEIREMPGIQKALTLLGIAMSVYSINEAANSGFNEGGRAGAIKEASLEGLKSIISTYHPLGAAGVLIGEMNYQMIATAIARSRELQASAQARAVEENLNQTIERVIRAAVDDPEARQNIIPLQGNPGAIDPNNPEATEEFIRSLVAAAINNVAQNRPPSQGIFSPTGQQAAAAQYNASRNTAIVKLAEAQALLQQIRSRFQEATTRAQTLQQNARQQLAALQTKAQSLKTHRQTLEQLKAETKKLQQLTREARENKPDPGENEANWVKVAEQAEKARSTICGYAGTCQGSEQPSAPSSAESQSGENLGRVVDMGPVPDPISSSKDTAPGTGGPLEGTVNSSLRPPSSGNTETSRPTKEGCTEEEAKDLRKKATALIKEVSKAIEEANKQQPAETETPALDELRTQIYTVQALVESLQREIDSYAEVLQGLTAAKAAIDECNSLGKELNTLVERFKALNLVAEVERLLAPFYASGEALRLRILAQNMQLEANSYRSMVESWGRSNLPELIQQAERSKADLEAFAEEAKAAIRTAEEAVKEAQSVIDEYEGLTSVKQIHARTEAMKALQGALECYSNIGATQQDQAAPMQGDQLRKTPVPSVIGLPAEEAKRELTAVGFVADLQVGDMAPPDKNPFQVYAQDPVAGTRVIKGQTVAITIYADRPTQGFQPGDGAKVDPRFAKATVTDGEMKIEKLSAMHITSAGAGPHCAIEGSEGMVPFEKAHTRAGSTWYWSIKKHATPAGARQLPSRVSELWKNVESHDLGHNAGFFRIVRKKLDNDETVLHISTQMPGNTAAGVAELRRSTYAHIVIYRDVFSIAYGGSVPEVNHDFAPEDQRILEKSKKLIDERFSPGNK